MSYLILFLWAFLAASILPIASEPYFLALVVNEKKLLFPILFATLGNILGGITTFYIGKKGGELIKKKISNENKLRYNKAELYIEKYGSVSLLISWIPIIGDVLVSLAGAFNLPFLPSLFWMSVGKFLRFLFLGLSAIGVLQLLK